MSIDRIKELILGNSWREAKSMPRIPHEYTLKRNWKSLEDFNFFVMYIRTNGYERIFWGKIYRYLDVAGYSYWTMGSPLEDTILINRAKIRETK